MWAELEKIAPFSPGCERKPHQIPGSTTTSGESVTVSAVTLTNVVWIWRKLLCSQMGESDNLSCLMNASVHLKQVVTSDANVGRQLKFNMGVLIIFAFLSIHSCTLMFFCFLFMSLILAALHGGYYAARNHFPSQIWQYTMQKCRWL